MLRGYCFTAQLEELAGLQLNNLYEVDTQKFFSITGEFYTKAYIGNTENEFVFIVLHGNSLGIGKDEREISASHNVKIVAVFNNMRLSIQDVIRIFQWKVKDFVEF